MNRSYRLIFNRSQQVSQAVSELAGRDYDGSDAQKNTTGNGAELSCGDGVAQVVIDGGHTATVPTNPSPAWNLGGQEHCLGKIGSGSIQTGE